MQGLENKELFKPSSSKNTIRKSKDNSWYYLNLSGEIASVIIIPIAIGIYIGITLDRRTSSYPKYTFLCLGAGFVFSFLGFISIIVSILKRSKK